MKYFLILFTFLFLGQIEAQINPPEFQCVRNDTLFWELPLSSCGTFNSYDIFFSTSSSGPFTLLSSIPDQTATLYFHNNPTGTTFYYFMTTNANCPGLPTLSSDTLNNESPDRSPINFVSVSNALVELEWTPSSSPEVTNYIIYRTSPVGALPIDTVTASMTQYIDLSSDPMTQSESYFVLAMDACGNTSVFDLPHFTVFLKTTIDACDRSIQLDWNRYRNWPNGIDQQEIWISVNNNSFELLATVAPQDSSYKFSDTNDGDNYCFYIDAIANGTANVSTSNTRCLNLNIVEPVRELYLKNVSIDANNQLEFTWTWNDNAEVANVDFEESGNGSAFSIVDSYDPGNDLSTPTQLTIDGIDTILGKQFYRLTSTDNCDSLKRSNVVSTVHLTGQAQSDQSNVLNWTAFDRPDGSIENYDIYRVIEGMITYANTVDGLTTTYVDAAIDVTNPAEANVCYFVIANAIVTNPAGMEMSIASQSNTICVQQFSDLIVPNAFVPEGVNKIFKPRIVFGTNVNYQMQIFDRWGKKVFETADQDQGWTGRDGFFYYPAGVYIYVIRLTQENGRVVERRGSVALLR